MNEKEEKKKEKKKEVEDRETRKKTTEKTTKKKKPDRSVRVQFSLCPLGGATNTFHAAFRLHPPLKVTLSPLLLLL